MKLAKIAHYRCDSYESTSYVSIPEDMTVEQLDEYVDLAATKAIEAEKLAKGVAPPYPDQNSLIKTMPKDTTLAQVDTELEKRKKEYAEWEAKKNTSRRSFLSWLEEVSNNTILPISDLDCGDFEVSCHWGHNHGLSPEYSDEGL